MDTPITAEQLDEVFRSVIDRASAKLVYGEPVAAEGKTILPVAKIRFGFGRGSGGKREEGQQGGGGGGGLVAKPVGVIEVTQAETRFIPASSNWTLIAAAAAALCFGFMLAPSRRR